MDTQELRDFTAQWLDQKPYIEAHTSGSTGAPKRIELPKSDMRASAEATCHRFGIDSGSLLHLCLPLRYIAGKMMMVRAYVSGARVISEPPSNQPLNSPSMRDAVSEGERITLTAIVPSQIEGLTHSPLFPLIDIVIVGGAPMTPRQERTLMEHGAHYGVRAYATYGMTETCSHVALREVGAEEYTAMPGITFATDERGCLIINAPHYTFRRLVTNDIVTLTSPESFIWRGRYDNVINSGGIKIHPEEIERTLAPLMGEEEFFITSRPSTQWGEEMVLVTTEAALSAIGLTEAGLMAACREILPSSKCPKAVIVRESLLHTSTGKLLRRLE